MENLKQDSVKFLYKLRLATKLQDVQGENITTEELYKCMKACIYEAAEEVLCYLEKEDKQNPDWWTSKLKDIVKNKKISYEK